MSYEVFESSVLRERIHKNVVMGLPVYVMVKPGFAKSYASYSTHFGSADTRFVDSRTGRETRVPDGIAHFLEHKMFESEDDSVMQEFSRIGASTNAFTDYSMTSYVFSTSDNFDKALSMLVSFVDNPRFSEKGVQKEKPIIEQELRMYIDMPGIQVETNLMEALYHNNPVRVEIGGTVESVNRISHDDLAACYQTFYQPSNMALFVAGGVDPETVWSTVAKARDGYAQNAEARGINRLFPVEPGTVCKPHVEKQMSVATPLVLIGLKDELGGKTSGKALLKRQATGDVLFSLLFGRSSHAYEKLYQSRLISEKFSASFEAEMSYGHATIGGESPEPERLFEAVVEILNDAVKNGIPQAGVERMRKKAMGEFVMLFNSLEYTARVFTSVLFKDAMIFDYYDALQSVTRAEVQDMLQQLVVPERMATSIVKPLAE